MCLALINKRFKPNNKMVRYAYKSVRRTDGEFFFPCNRHKGDSRIPLGKWIKAVCPWLEIEPTDDDEGEKYRGGFHCYMSKRPSFHYGNRILRVKLRGIICTGKQDDQRVIVAKEMFVPVPKKRKRKRA